LASLWLHLAKNSKHVNQCYAKNQDTPIGFTDVLRKNLKIPARKIQDVAASH
jgi:hypothetical protein